MKKRFSHASVKLDRDVSWCMLRAYNYVCGSYKYGDSTKLCHTHLMLCDLEILLSFTYWIVTSFSNLYGIGTSCTQGSFLQCSQTYNMRVCVYVSVYVCLCLCLCLCPYKGPYRICPQKESPCDCSQPKYFVLSHFSFPTTGIRECK